MYLTYLSSKYFAISVKRVPSSRPVCMDPINTRFLSVVNPKSKGLSKWGYRDMIVQKLRKFWVRAAHVEIVVCDVVAR